jgi:nickel-type superoxide dismutase maturation protease
MFPFGLFRVEGDSMEPTYKSGDLLLGRRWKLSPQEGDVVVVLAENRPLIKRLKSINDEEIQVEGDNKSASTDSRTFGPLPKNAIKATILCRLYKGA